MAANYFLRGDGSVNHIVEFNPQTGVYICSHGGQGYGQGSSWTRGQAWAVYGFALSYRHTNDPVFLDAAKQVAHYFMANIPESGLIPVDFRQPETPAYEDSTAAAIAACGLLEVAAHVNVQEKAAYEKAAKKLLFTLSEKRCNFGEENDCILEKCTASYDEKQHEYNIIYGDYFYMEGMFRLHGKWADIW
jgi:unsaturated chondroitin disaccharide hydrolase